MAAAVHGQITSDQRVSLIARVKREVPIKEISTQDFETNPRWQLYSHAIPAYVAESRIGACMIIGASVRSSRMESRVFIVQPVTPYGSAERLNRNAFYVVPESVQTGELSMLSFTYLVPAVAIITRFVPILENPGESVVTLYEYRAKTEETKEDSSTETTMTLNELNSKIDMGDTAAEYALTIFAFTNLAISSQLHLRTRHLVSTQADERLILSDAATAASISARLSSAAPSEKFTVDKNLLLPDFIRNNSSKTSTFELP